jgi:hypothetical protein
MYHVFGIIILYMYYNTRLKSASKGVIVVCFHQTHHTWDRPYLSKPNPKTTLTICGIDFSIKFLIIQHMTPQNLFLS